VGKKISTTLLNWHGVVVYDGLLSVVQDTLPAKKMLKLKRAYLRALDTKTLITHLTTTPIEEKLEEPASKARAQPTEASMRLLRPTIDRLRLAPSAPDGTMWVFRRHGYTQRTNPYFLVSVLAGAMPVLPFQKLPQLVPTVEDIVNLMGQALDAVGRKPQAIGVDAEEIVEATRSVLESTGVYVGYYPPPSEEEEAFSNRTNPFLDHGKPKCPVCGSRKGADGGPLLRCGRCTKEHYCCKEHQKTHWKLHKYLCVPK